MRKDHRLVFDLLVNQYQLGISSLTTTLTQH